MFHHGMIMSKYVKKVKGFLSTVALSTGHQCLQR